MPTTMQLIGKVEVGSGGASSISFSNIPGTYTDLYLVGSYRGTVTNADNWRDVRLNINGGGYGSQISARYVHGNGSSVFSGTGTSIAGGVVVPSNATSSTFSTNEHYFPNYAGSTNKSFSATFATEANATNAMLMAFAGLWSNTSAITSIEVSPDSGNFAQYSTAYLYGITSAAGSIPGTFGVDATGGDVTITGGYKIHTFTSTGTFTVNQPGWYEYLVIGGGGAGAWAQGGGGGAGGYLTGSVYLTPDSYAALVGAGGAGGNVALVNGNDSSIGSRVIAFGGGGGATSSSTPGANGGSGGGGACQTGVTAGGSAVSGQGNAGAAGTGFDVAGGGGGGAGAAGSGRQGGNGAASSITGASVTRAGGGSGGGKSASTLAGGSGGGGTGSGNTSAGTAGQVNTGSGGGGGGSVSGVGNGAGGSGGSGIVIIRYPVS